ncbi:hypothetical protein H4I96_09410 [Botrytis cinerea]
MNQHQVANAEAQRGIHHSGEYHDIELKCKDNILVAHSAILLPRSTILANREDERWSITETNLRQFDMSDQDSVIVNAALSYIYTSEYNDDPVGTRSNTNMPSYVPAMPRQSQDSFPAARNLTTHDCSSTRKSAEKFYHVAHLPSSPLLYSKADVLDKRPAFVAAASLFCDNMSDLFDRKSDELWKTMKIVSFTNYMGLKDTRWEDREAKSPKRIFWEREDFMMELLEAGWHLYHDLSIGLRNSG